ncbi:DUF2177 family protein [Ancylobacter radicis]|uniref:DUF2177 family protein n=1 Tax=Ancylobacter radicis TaxID=2836179 RepID=UPI00350FE879
MSIYILSYLMAGLVFLAFDAVWLGTMADRIYRPLMGDLVQDGFSFAPAAAFYLLYVAGIVIFAIHPAIGSGKWSTALIFGLLFGLMAYGTYDLTNQATLKNWPLALTVIDMAWGTFVTGMSATLGYLAARTLGRWIGI